MSKFVKRQSPSILDMIDYKMLKKAQPEVLPGGLADGKSLGDIAKAHGVPVEQVMDEFIKGRMIELEHVDDKIMAGEIAKDHLVEDPIYYSKLEQMEQKTAQIEDVIYKIKDRLIELGLEDYADSELEMESAGWWEEGEEDETQGVTLYTPRDPDVGMQGDDVVYFTVKNDYLTSIEFDDWMWENLKDIPESYEGLKDIEKTIRREFGRDKDVIDLSDVSASTEKEAQAQSPNSSNSIIRNVQLWEHGSSHFVVYNTDWDDHSENTPKEWEINGLADRIWEIIQPDEPQDNEYYDSLGMDIGIIAHGDSMVDMYRYDYDTETGNFILQGHYGGPKRDPDVIDLSDVNAKNKKIKTISRIDLGSVGNRIIDIVSNSELKKFLNDKPLGYVTNIKDRNTGNFNVTIYEDFGYIDDEPELVDVLWVRFREWKPVDLGWGDEIYSTINGQPEAEDVKNEILNELRIDPDVIDLSDVTAQANTSEPQTLSPEQKKLADEIINEFENFGISGYSEMGVEYNIENVSRNSFVMRVVETGDDSTEFARIDIIGDGVANYHMPKWLRDAFDNDPASMGVLKNYQQGLKKKFKDSDVIDLSDISAQTNLNLVDRSAPSVDNDRKKMKGRPRHRLRFRNEPDGISEKNFEGLTEYHNMHRTDGEDRYNDPGDPRRGY